VSGANGPIGSGEERAAPTGRPTAVTVTLGEPTEEEAAAIVAAIEAAWPRPGAAAEPVGEPARWKFSGRWWSKPVPLRRERPGHYA
jgi:hypothetical protein